MARIVVCGYMIRLPLAGNVLAYFHYVLGLHLLGHDVMYLEESGWPASCYDPSSQTYGDDPASGMEAVRKLMAEYGIREPICYINRDTGNVRGHSWNEVKRMLAAADLLLNIGGVCWLPEFRLCRSRIYIDMDPLFTQVGRFGAESIHEHNLHFSYGVNIGKGKCTVPDNGIDWHATLPPVVPEMWETSIPGVESNRKEHSPFTTIANWNAYGSVIFEGEHYGQKDEELLRLLHLPRYTSQRLELSLSGIDDERKRQFQNAGWLIRDAGEVSRDMKTYRDYIKTSHGELSVAKNAYVKTRSGWFSDRSVCYLASGRPVIMQDTGFIDYLKPGSGVLPFSTADEAVTSIDRVNADYRYHSRAARETAENIFSYKILLPNIIDMGMKWKRFFPSSLRKEKKP